MSFVHRETVVVTGSSTGDTTAFTAVVTGKILLVKYTRPATTPLSSDADFTVTTEDTSQSVWSQSNVDATTEVRPRAATHTTAGVAHTFGSTTASTDVILEPVVLANERIKIVIAQGSTTGAATAGTFDVLIG